MAVIASSRSPVARVLLRLPRSLHRSTAKAAAAMCVSFNEYCIRRLAAPPVMDAASTMRSIVLGRARSVFGDALEGVVALGSWARGEAAVDSDVDVLIVIAGRVDLTRGLYRAWDAEPLRCDGRAIDAHFAHLPPAGAAPGAVWCEAAVDGIVWHDRDGGIARWLAEVRRAIAAGRLVRAVVHGHPYWKGAA